MRNNWFPKLLPSSEFLSAKNRMFSPMCSNVNLNENYRKSLLVVPDKLGCTHSNLRRICCLSLMAFFIASIPLVAYADKSVAQFNLTGLATGDGSTGFVLNGINAFDFSGTSIGSAGDVNGDGMEDIVIGAFGGDANGNGSGEVYVVFGSSSPSAFPAEFELSSLATGDGSTGFVLNGIQPFDSTGWSVSSAGDVNGDGTNDIIIGAPEADPNGQSNAGESYVVFGRSTGFPAVFELSSLVLGDGSAGFVLNGIDSGDRSGQAVGAAGDVNSDGVEDIIIGANQANQPGAARAGESYVVFGRTAGFPAQFELSNLATGDGSEGFVLNGADAFDESGWSVNSAGDLNDDGHDDIVIGTPIASHGYVVFGRSTGFAPEFELSSLTLSDGGTGFVLNGALGDSLGGSVSRAGDVNGDGIDDLLIGADGTPQNNVNDAGASYLIYGRATGFPAEINVSELSEGNGSMGFELRGIGSSDGAGISVAAAGDVNGDGLDDIVVGAHLADEIGESYLVFGRMTNFMAEFDFQNLALGDSSTGIVLNGGDAGDLSGSSVSSAGDVNGDGIDDLLVAAQAANPNGSFAAGKTYVVYGRLFDYDNDGVTDTFDNCRTVANTDQRDTNSDGYGNLCDPDINNDGVINFLDIFTWTLFFGKENNGDEDFNGDGVANFTDYDFFSQFFMQPPGPASIDLQGDSVIGEW